MSGYDATQRLGAVFARMERFAGGEFRGAALAVALGGDQVAEWYAGEAAPGLASGEDVLWPLASISKSYTAAAIMALVERGDLTLTLPVHALLPAFGGEGREAVRLGHLLTHTAGLIYESPRMEELLRQHTPLAAIVDEAYTHPLLFPPGTRYSYSDFGYALAARMAEVAAGRPFPDIVREVLLVPGGLTNTFLPPPPGDYGGIARVEGSLAYGSDGAMYNSPYALALAHPAFGFVATAADLLRFGLLLAPGGRQRVLSGAAIHAMTADRTSVLTLEGQGGAFPHVPESYGLGLSVGSYPDLAGADLLSSSGFGHDGASGCMLLVDPAANLTMAFVSNRHFSVNPDRWRYCLGSLANGVLAALTHRAI